LALAAEMLSGTLGDGASPWFKKANECGIGPRLASKMNAFGRMAVLAGLI
jgi:hypothetical protein